MYARREKKAEERGRSVAAGVGESIGMGVKGKRAKIDPINFSQKIQTMQCMKSESGDVIGLDMAVCSLLGISHNDNRSYATVRSQAWMSSSDHKVVYEIKWDSQVVPGGTHLGQKANTASDWIVDKSADGEPIGDRKGTQTPYFNNENEMKRNPKNGKFFWYNDPIQQRRLSGGSWWFRLKVVDGSGTLLSQSHPVEVDWDSV